MLVILFMNWRHTARSFQVLDALNTTRSGTMPAPMYRIQPLPTFQALTRLAGDVRKAAAGREHGERVCV